ncbi:MAG TPA: hypothetical protein VKQ28_12330 [Candidatus Acidoferrum sp.]|nr:hypothetical protein [Candidatus Acidoferrum sp.]
MNRNLWACSLVGSAVLLAAGTFRAQEPPPPPGMDHHAEGPDAGGPGPFGNRIELLGFEGMHPGKVVKGVPFSATANSETTQTLQDGTTIHRNTSSNLFRDSEGRFRREVTLSGFGPLQTSGNPRTMITIGDPVAGAHYMLDPQQKVAHKMAARRGGKLSDKTQSFEDRMQKRMAKEEASGELKKESLGTQAINGVNAEGTRITRTIPAGQVGNDKPIQIVFERWYSPDLQMVVKSTHSDPRLGTTTYTLTNIQRSEPAAALFTVPADYTVKEGGPGARNRRRAMMPGAPAGAPADAPPPPPGS